MRRHQAPYTFVLTSSRDTVAIIGLARFVGAEPRGVSTRRARGTSHRLRERDGCSTAPRRWRRLPAEARSTTSGEAVPAARAGVAAARTALRRRARTVGSVPEYPCTS